MLTFKTYTQRFVKPLWGWYLGGFLLLALVNAINLIIPQMAKEAINDLAQSKVEDRTANLALGIVGLGLLMIIVRTLSRIVLFWPGRRIETTSKSFLFDKLLTLPETFYHAFGMGDLISRLSSDLTQLRIFFAFGILQILNVMFLTVFTISMMASIHPSLTAATMAPLLLMLAITKIAMPKMHAASRDNQKALGELTSRVTESFVHVHVIQANAATEAFTARIAKENDDVFQTNMRMVYVRTMVFPLMTCLAGLAQLVVLLYGGYEVTKGHLTVGDILAFNVYIGLLTFPLTALGIIIAVYQRAKTALVRLSDIDTAAPESKVDISPLVKSRFESGHETAPLLAIRDLSYTFPGKSECSLDHISLTIRPGERIGLFGRVGSGKSTLMNVITRLLDPAPGTVFFRGEDVLSVSPQDLRRDIGYALQSVHLFSASVRDNLLFGLDHDVSQKELEDAAQSAQMLGEIKQFPQGWDTQIGEKGVRLSGGQKQRLALARLFLRKTPLVLLDDVLSAVDHVTERRLIQHLHQLGVGMIIASHRGTALKQCDEILILSEGKIIERGSFEVLATRYPELARDVH